MNRGTIVHRYSKETVRWAKEQGFFDAGAFYRKIGALSRYPKHRRWDREYDDRGEEQA